MERLGRAFAIDDPRGAYMFRLQDHVAKLERDVEGIQIQFEQRRLARRMTAPIDRDVIFNSERR